MCPKESDIRPALLNPPYTTHTSMIHRYVVPDFLRQRRSQHLNQNNNKEPWNYNRYPGYSSEHLILFSHGFCVGRDGDPDAGVLHLFPVPGLPAGTSSCSRSLPGRGESAQHETAFSLSSLLVLTLCETEMCFFARPAWVTLVAVTAIQHVAAHFAFIKKEGGTTDLNNRYFLRKERQRLSFDFRSV